mmetsp:Transcript_16991/g.54492  ORF Transcript_16991/g.54492 Transcript_16991/m.54492 type:complete len:169 (-) Transcript_16991:137-643(-)|eukprot:CAMPEP_0196776936 /NCGR_PEP_ID=MMETSP1104-20130614/4926_1 /TAXON_ID=33652 /ORGANISM="Cafeteria sp., Strain Caron Lab Isolate" /LENGTH=168 /DNA_ID=CAMNT_0042147105 /DNA_START=27 /DNA_END=533 /DNA_ORIENTATION=-
MSDSLWAAHMEKTAWAQLGLVLFQNLSPSFAPSYNFGIALWGLYCAYNAQGRAVMTYIVLLAGSLLCDIIVCSIYGHDISKGNFAAEDKYSNTYKFSLAMLIINMFVKVPSMLVGYKVFVELGGPWSLSQNAGGEEYYGGEQGGAYQAPAAEGTGAYQGQGVGGGDTV